MAIISGGGAGHEPAHATYTGRGMLAACVSGDVFASPSAAQIGSAIDLANSDAGVMLVVNNYTGDCLNFGLAAEKARAALAYAGNTTSGGVEMVIVGDDVAVGRARGGLVGRRGLAGNIFTCKVLGAAAANGLGVQALAKLGNELVGNMVTVATSLDHCHVPGRAKDAEGRGALAEEACELGMGIHNEPGFKQMAKRPEPADLIAEMLQYLLDPNDKDRAYTPFEKDSAPVLYVNNLGGMSVLELNAICDETIEQLGECHAHAHAHAICFMLFGLCASDLPLTSAPCVPFPTANTWSLHPSRVYCNTYMTSLNAPGFSITLVNQSRVSHRTGQDLLSLLDAPTEAFSWSGVRTGWAPTGTRRDRKAEETEAEKRIEALRKEGKSMGGLAQGGSEGEGSGSSGRHGGPLNGDAAHVERVITLACEAALAAEPELTKFDTIVGDGDCGETLAGCGKAVLTALKAGKIRIANSAAAATVIDIGTVIESNMGGTSGAIYALFFAGLVQGLLSSPHAASSTAATQQDWAHAALTALDNLGRYTPARPGDRTLVDALSPFCKTLGEGKSLDEAVREAKRGAEGTKKMTARLGRATYVGQKADGGEMPPDPGAWGIWALVEGIAKGVNGAA